MKLRTAFFSIFNFSVLLFSFSYNSYSQASCATATPIIIDADGNVCVTGSNVGATNDGTYNSCDVLPAGNQVWYTFTAQGSSNTITVTPTGSPAAQQVVVTLTEYGCGSGSINTCNASATNGGTATATWGYSAGTQVIVQVTTNSTDGNFQLCITSVNPPPAPGEDCGSATLLCDKSTFTVNSMSGVTASGVFPSCFLSAVQRDIWYYFTVGQSGTLTFEGTPLGNAEFDWGLYNISMGCPGTEVACNYNFAGGMGTPFGIGPTSCTTCPTSAFNNNSACDEHCPTINVTAGQTYALLIDNYSANNIGFTLSWGGTFLMAPTANFTVTPTSGCGSVTACVTNTSVSATSYQWDFANGNTSTAANPACQNYTTPGVYLISLIATSSSGCTDVASASVTVSPGPTLTTSQVNVNCFGQCTGSATVTATGGTPSYTYSWSGGGASSTKSGLCAGNATVTVTDASGCMNTATVTITQPASALAVSVTGTNASCNGVCDGSVTATASGGTPSYTYLWSGGGTTSGKTALCAGVNSVTVTDSKSCTATGSYTVTQPPVIIAGFTYNGNKCLTGNSFNFTNTGTMGGTYSWNFPGGSPATSTLENPTGITWSTAGTYTITQNITVGSCMNSATLNIIVFAQPTVTISKTDVICNGLCNGTLSATGSGGTPAYTYSWNGGLGTGGSKTGVCAASYTVTVTDANGCTGTANATITQPVLLTATITPTNIACNGSCTGSGSVAAAGGTSPYTYSWGASAGLQITNPAVSLCAGTHSVTVTDNKGCTATASTNITQPASMVLTVTTTSSTCGLTTGSASVSVSGGNPAYSYNWSSGCVGSNCPSLGAGTYTVTVTDASGCTKTGSGTISDAGGISASIAINQNITCFGLCNGQATASVTGGVAPYSYVWSAGVSTVTTSASNVKSALCGGNISVTITDANGCASSGAGVVTQPTALIGNSTVVNETCAGLCNGSITNSISGGTNPYTYAWPGGPTGPVPGKSGLCANTYIVTVTDVSGCSITVSSTVMGGGTITASITGTNASCNNICNGSADLTASGGTTPYTYAWSNLSNVEDPTALCDGTFTVTVTDAAGCISMGSVTITEPTAVTVTTSNTPATCGQINGTVSATGGGGTGPYGYSWNTFPVQNTQTAAGLNSGTYTVTVTDSKGCTVTGSSTVIATAGGTVSISVNNHVTCNGLCNGSATASMAGGTAPFTITWNDPLPVQTTATATGLCAGIYSVTITDFNGCSGTASITITQPPVLAAAITDSLDLNCNNVCTGVVSVSVSGGTGSYGYLWNPSISTGNSASALCASNYSITVSDGNGCTVVAGVTLTQPPLLTVSMSQTSASCSTVCDGTASAATNGGTPPYLYLWNNSQSTSTNANLCSGSTYIVTVTDSKGCTVTSPATITAMPDIALNFTVTDATCGLSNGSVTVTITNGTGPFTPVWNTACSNTLCSNLIAGTYFVTVTDSKGCSSTGNASVNSISGPTALISGTTDPACDGSCTGSASVTVTDGVPPYTYLWNTNPGQNGTTATALCTGSYTVQVFDANNCVTSVTATVTQPGALTISFTTNTPVTCFGQCNGVLTVSVTGGMSPYTYGWGGGQTTSTLNNLCAATYNLTVTDSKGCTAAANATITQPAQLYALITTDSVNCSGSCDGGAIASVGGGTPPYIYSWGNGQSGSVAVNLCATTYIFSVTDANGCISISSVSINTPLDLVASISGYGDVTCFGSANGYAQAVAAGGTPGYTYNWSNNQQVSQATNLSGGTYTISVTDFHGCLSTAQITITEPAAISILMSDTSVTCNGLCNGVATATVSGGTPAYSFLWSGNASFQTTSTATGLCAGNYSVTVTDSKSCTKTMTTIINQPQLLGYNSTPVPSTCGSPNGSACVTVIGGVVPYTAIWDNTPPTTGFCASGLPAGTYNPVLTDGNGCTYTAPVTINDIAGPTVDTIYTTDVTCSGISNGNAIASVSGGTSPFTYVWKDGAVTVATGSVSVFGIPGGASYSFTVIDGNGCSSSKSFVINEPVTVVSAIISDTNVSCFGLCDGSATVGAAGGDLPYTYNWSTFPVQNTPSASGLCAGTYNVAVYDSNGCLSTSSVTITQPAAIIISPLVDSVNCNGGSDGSISLPPSPTGGTPPYTYVWLPAGTGNGPVVTNLIAGGYSLTVSDYKGCTASAIINVGQPQQLIVSAASTEERCGSVNGSVAALVSGGSPAFTYFWIPVSSVTPIVNNLQAGNYSVYVTDKNGCLAADTVEVLELLGPEIDANVIQHVLCYGGSTGTAEVILVRPSFPPYTYTWNPVVTGTNQVTGLAAGQYFVSVTDSIGCTAIDTILVTQPPDIILTTNPVSTTICYGQSTQISASASGGVPNYGFTWSNPGFIGGGPHTANPLVTTIYTVTVTDANGCIRTGTTTITVLDKLNVTAADVQICEGDAATVTANATGGTGIYTYSWSNLFVGQSQQVSGLIAQTIFAVTVSDNCSLDETTNMTVFVNAKPVVNFTANITEGCEPLSLQFSDNTTVVGGSVTTWQWDFGDNSASSQSNPAHQYVNDGIYTVTLTATSSAGCSNFLTLANYINVFPLPDAFFVSKPEVTTNINPIIQFFDSSSGIISIWDWNFGDSLATSTNNISGLENPVHEYKDTGTYVIRLTVTTNRGCVDSYIDSVRINSEYILFAPSAFTPNDDNVNDEFFPVVVGLNKNKFNLYIFDRWGDLLYETTDISKPWNGKANNGGKLAQQDVYVWIISTEDLNGTNHQYVGHVTLVK